MAKRKGISKQTRFEVFKRDSFTCQYCGRSAPEIVLHVDHIQPVSQDGENDILNLITSCVDCNLGKSDKLLSDNTAVQKQKAQLDELNERREQIEMMVQWRSGLRELCESELEAVMEEWESLTDYYLNDKGRLEAKKLIKKYGVQSVLEAISKSVMYLKAGTKGYTKESVNTAWGKVSGICAIQAMPEWEQQIYHIRNIARSRMYWGCSNSSAAYLLDIMKEAYHLGADIDKMREIAKAGYNYTECCKVFEDFIKANNAESKKANG